MGTVRIRFPLPTRSTNTQRPSRCWMCPHCRELAPSQGAAQKHRQNRAVPFSFDGFDHGLSKQVSRLFPGEPVPCPGAGLADTLEGHDSLGYAAIEQPVFGRFCGQLADRRQREPKRHPTHVTFASNAQNTGVLTACNRRRKMLKPAASLLAKVSWDSHSAADLPCRPRRTPGNDTESSTQQ
jgi:hypothetical protein